MTENWPQYIDSASGPPRRVDGPSSTPTNCGARIGHQPHDDCDGTPRLTPFLVAGPGCTPARVVGSGWGVPNTGPTMWVDGNGLQLSVQAPSGPLYLQELGVAVLVAKMAGTGEVLRFTYDVVDPEDGSTIRGAARIVLEDLPDPRAQEQRDA